MMSISSNPIHFCRPEKMPVDVEKAETITKQPRCETSVSVIVRLGMQTSVVSMELGTDVDSLKLLLCMRHSLSSAEVKLLRNGRFLSHSAVVSGDKINDCVFDVVLRVRGGMLQSTQPAPPLTMCPVNEVTDHMRNIQRSDPLKWSVTLDQWNGIVDHCRQQPQWNASKGSKGYVDLYDMNTVFVKPFTAGTACGVSILMNKDPKRSQIMVSHCWGESVDQCQVALNEHLLSGKFAAQEREFNADEKTRLCVWFCLFANYQAREYSNQHGIQDVGPTIPEQLQLDPFGVVIAGVGYMVAIHTTTAELYDRLWCVYEVGVALTTPGVVVGAAVSDNYANAILHKYENAVSAGMEGSDALIAAGLEVETLRAKCGDSDDERMIWKKVLEVHGGFERLNASVLWFRARAITDVGLRMNKNDLVMQVADYVLELLKFPTAERTALNLHVHREEVAVSMLRYKTPEEGRIAFKRKVEQLEVQRFMDQGCRKSCAELCCAVGRLFLLSIAIGSFVLYGVLITWDLGDTSFSLLSSSSALVFLIGSFFLLKLLCRFQEQARSACRKGCDIVRLGMYSIYLRCFRGEQTSSSFIDLVTMTATSTLNDDGGVASSASRATDIEASPVGSLGQGLLCTGTAQASS